MLCICLCVILKKKITLVIYTLQNHIYSSIRMQLKNQIHTSVSVKNVIETDLYDVSEMWSSFPSLFLRYTFAFTPLKSLCRIGEKWDLQGICYGFTREEDINYKYRGGK